MRILLVDNSKGWGGAEEMLFSLATGLRNRGHYVVMFLDEGSETVTKFVRADFNVWAFQRKSFRLLQSIIKMIRIARNEKFDLVHVHRNHDLLVGKIVGYFSGKLPLVLTQHCRLCKSTFFVINLPDRIAAVSKYIADGMTERFLKLDSKINVVHNGIDPTEFEHLHEDFWCRWSELIGKGPLLGVVGYFYKNQEELIELLPFIKDEFPDVMLLIIGRDDSKRKFLEKKAEQLGVAESVLFTGSIPHAEMKHALAGLDLNLSAFRREGFGLSVLEGLAAGTPFLGYRSGGYPEIIEQGENGYLKDTFAELLQEILSLLKDKDRYSKMREQAKKSVSNKFTIDNMITNYENIYKSTN
ncbi:MAG: glycosyltransferase family 1 protein [Geobacter sp.]|nr:MAG: glycosyltransferase family 1 protein [Geobacter sp.]